MTKPTNTPRDALSQLSKAAQQLVDVSGNMLARAMENALEDPNANLMKQPREPLEEAKRDVTDALRTVENTFRRYGTT